MMFVSIIVTSRYDKCVTGTQSRLMECPTMASLQMDYSECDLTILFIKFISFVGMKNAKYKKKYLYTYSWCIWPSDCTKINKYMYITFYF